MDNIKQLELPFLRYFINVYDSARAYGGPEEGGWFYNDYTFIGCVGAFPDEETAHIKAREVEKAMKDEKAVYHMGHGPHDGANEAGEGDDAYLIKGGRWGRGSFRTFVEEKQGKDFDDYIPWWEAEMM